MSNHAILEDEIPKLPFVISRYPEESKSNLFSYSGPVKLDVPNFQIEVDNVENDRKKSHKIYIFPCLSKKNSFVLMNTVISSIWGYSLLDLEYNILIQNKEVLWFIILSINVLCMAIGIVLLSLGISFIITRISDNYGCLLGFSLVLCPSIINLFYMGIIPWWGIRLLINYIDNQSNLTMLYIIYQILFSLFIIFHFAYKVFIDKKITSKHILELEENLGYVNEAEIEKYRQEIIAAKKNIPQFVSTKN